MRLITLAAADLRHHKLANSLHVLLLTLGTAIIAALLLIGTQIADRFERDADGVDLVIGAKGSPLQLILSTVYHLDIPTGNIPLSEADRWAKNSMVASAIPLSLGDNVRGYRIVGTTAALVEHYHAHLASGQLWQQPMEAVIGSDVAAAGLKQGAPFVGAHGLSAGGHLHADHSYKVVGVLAPTGSVLDRLVLTSLESVWEVHGAHHHHEAESPPVKNDDDDDDHDESPVAVSGAYQPSQEITALLVHYRTPLAAAALPRMINTQSNLQAAVPAFETARLLQMLGLGFDLLRVLGGLLIATAALSVFISLYSAMEMRQYDLAVLRSLGLSRGRVVVLLWLQAMILSVAGTLIGLGFAHAAIGLLGQMSGSARGIHLSGWSWPAAEWPLLLLPLLVGTLASAIPAWRAFRSDVAATLSGG